jgi:DNA-binding CsgD family transcriptional regulator
MQALTDSSGLEQHQKADRGNEFSQHLLGVPSSLEVKGQLRQPIARLAFDFRQSKYLYCDEAMEGVTGYSAKETIELGLEGFTARYDSSTAEASFTIMADSLRVLKRLSTVQRDRAQASAVHRFQHRHGHWMWILVQSVPLQFDPNSKSLWLSMSYLSDITPHYFLARPGGSITFPTSKSDAADTQTTMLELPLRTPQPGVELSSREREVLRMIVSGQTSKEIADKLGLAVPTVSTHRKNLLIKTRCRNTAELVSFAVSFGLM